MKTIKIIAATLMVVLFTTLTAYADEPQTKNYHKIFKVSQHDLLDIENKYGDVVIENGEAGVIEISIVISVETGNEDKAQRLFDNIRITLEQSEGTVKAQTEILDEIRNTKFSIDYKVKMPATQNLNLYNKYGDVYIDQANGLNNISVKYGNLKAGKLLNGNSKPRSTLTLKYVGSATIEECNWLKVDVGYSKLKIRQSTALIMVSKYSKIYIDKANSIVCESKYDNPFKVGTVNNFICTGKYSEYDIENLISKFEIQAKYSDIDIQTVSKEFESIEAVISYGKLDMELPQGVDYQFKADTEYCSLDAPNGKNISRIQDHTEVKMYGYIGNNPQVKAKVRIVSKYGDVDLD